MGMLLIVIAIGALSGCSGDNFKPITGWDEECEASLEEHSARLEAAAADLTGSLGEDWSGDGPVCDTDSGPPSWYVVEPDGPVEASELDAIGERVRAAGWEPTSDVTGPDRSQQLAAGDRALTYVGGDGSDFTLAIAWHRSTGVMYLEILSPEQRDAG